MSGTKYDDDKECEGIDEFLDGIDDRSLTWNWADEEYTDLMRYIIEQAQIRLDAFEESHRD